VNFSGVTKDIRFPELPRRRRVRIGFLACWHFWQMPGRVNENRKPQARQSYLCWPMDSHNPLVESSSGLNCLEREMPLMSKPAVSVIVPLYNKAETVEETLSRVLAQTFTDHEIIVVDDGSTDGSASLVAGIADPRLTLILQDNGGVSVARNRGIMAAQSSWIALLDADDLWDANHLERQWQAVHATDVEAAFSNVRLESRPGTPMIKEDVPAGAIVDYFDFALTQGGYPNMTSAMIIRRDAAIATGLFTVGVAMGEDLDLWCRLALRGPMLYTAALTVTYNDVPRGHNTAGNLGRRPEFPFFAACLPTLLDRGEIPSRLEASAGRYANFLVLEYARQLLDRGLNREARDVLRHHCNPRLDPMRFGRRYARTYGVGRAAFALSGGRIQSG
jgi:glycosyltransferase involved in cell wall biosynthesis